MRAPLGVGARWEFSSFRVPSEGPPAAGFSSRAAPRAHILDLPDDIFGTDSALCRLHGIAPRSKESPMVSGAYLRQQAEILIAMSRATLDLGMAGRLREMASELQARAAEQEDKRGSNDNEMGNVRPPSRIGS
jgi:hypothetical protein